MEESKLACEQLVMDLCSKSELKYTIIRPPLVYGPNLKGNLLTISKILKYQIPLPINCFQYNRRSLISTLNLIDFINTCITDERSYNRIFIPSDGEYVSTYQIIAQIAKLHKYKVRSFYFPRRLFEFFIVLAKGRSYATKLFGDLIIDSSINTEPLEWSPPYSFDSSFMHMAFDEV